MLLQHSRRWGAVSALASQQLLRKAAIEALEDRVFLSVASNSADPAALPQPPAYVSYADQADQRALNHWLIDWKPTDTQAPTTAPTTTLGGDSATPPLSDASAAASTAPPVPSNAPATQSPAPTAPIAAPPTQSNASPLQSDAAPVQSNPPATQSSPAANLPGLSYLTPASNPALPSGMNTFSPTLSAQAPSTAAPVIAAANSAAAPDQSLALTGIQFTSYSDANAYSDTRFIVYGQTNANNAAVTDAAIQDIMTNGATVTIDASEPANSMYLLWAQNSQGVSAPIAINQTTAWWMGAPGETLQTAQGQTTVSTSVGQTMSVYGKNLSNGAAAPLSWVYLQPTDGTAGQWATVTSVNPYKVDFTASTPGTYQVWINNGLGGQYGWSEVTQNGAPVLLQVAASAHTWSGKTYNFVTDFGADNTGTRDDSAAIQNAIVALHAGDTLYFPTGTYLFGGNEHFDLPGNVRVLGDGPTQSTLLFEGQMNSSYKIRWANDGGTIGEMDSIGITFDGTAPANGYSVLLSPGGCANVTLNHVQLIANGLSHPLDSGAAQSSITVLSSVIQGRDVCLSGTQNVLIDHTQFYEAFGGQSAVTISNTYDVSITNCTAQNQDPTASSWTGSGQGRFLEYQYTGPVYYQYVANNTTVNMAAPTEINSGEEINIEGDRAQRAYGQPSTLTSNTLTLTSATFLRRDVWGDTSGWAGMTVIITQGTGVGQMRKVQAVKINYNADQSVASVTLTLDRPWTLAPDANSHVYVGGAVYDSAFYSNTLQAQPGPLGAAQNLYSATGFEIFTGGYDLIFDGNTTQNMKCGAMIWSAGVDNPSFFDQVINNNFQNTLQWGIDVAGTYQGDLQDPNYIGVTARNNTVTGPIKAGIGLGTQSTTGPEALTVIENNSITATLGLSVGNASSDVLVRNNVFTAVDQTSMGAQFSSVSGALLRGNTYVNFGAGKIYTTTLPGGSLPATSLTAPYHLLLSTVTAGSSTQIALPLWNDGTAAVAWTGSTDAPWLTLQSSSGNIADEKSPASAILIVNATDLTAGNYSATVTLTYAAGSRQVTKTFHVQLTVQ